MSGAQQPGGAQAAPMPAPSQDLAPMQMLQAYKSAPNMAMLNQQPQQQSQPWQPPAQQYTPAQPAPYQTAQQTPMTRMNRLYPGSFSPYQNQGQGLSQISGVGKQVMGGMASNYGQRGNK